MAVPIYLSGVNASVRQPGTPEKLHSFAEWEAAGECGTPEVTNFRTAPYQALLTGIFKGTITLNGPKDSSGDDNFILGGGISEIRLYWNGSLCLKYIGLVASYRLSQNVQEHGKQQIVIQTTGALSVALATDGATVAGGLAADQLRGAALQPQLQEASS
jgi:hypothetical protein